MNKNDITYLIAQLEATQRNISPNDDRETTTRDVVTGRKRISFALNHLRFLRDGNASVAYEGGEKESSVDPASLSVEAHDEGALRKVYLGLWQEGIYGQKAADVVSALQNVGILFRERA